MDPMDLILQNLGLIFLSSSLFSFNSPILVTVLRDTFAITLFTMWESAFL